MPHRLRDGLPRQFPGTAKTDEYAQAIIDKMHASDHDLGRTSVECDFGGDWTPSNAPAAPPLSPQLEAFLLDRFSTTLEDPYTGRRLKL